MSLGDWQSLLASLPPPHFKNIHCCGDISFRAVGPTPLLVCKADCLQSSYTKNAFGLLCLEYNWWNWLDAGFGSLQLQQCQHSFQCD